MLPESGAVLGIDTGWSETAATTGVCVFSWDQERVFPPRLSRIRTNEKDRRQMIGAIGHVVAIAIDGPLARKFGIINRHRATEAILSRGVLQKRGKPGSTNSTLGRHLHRHSTNLARLALELARISCERAGDGGQSGIVEAFPNLFLGALHSDSDYPRRCRRGKSWTDLLFPRVLDPLNRLLVDLLPGRRIEVALDTITDHEHRAAFVCALTALSYASKRYVAVGHDDDGYIMLPPLEHWGLDVEGQPWLARGLRANLPGVLRDYAGTAIVRDGSLWRF